jgi:hypothetical protein
MDNRKEFEDYKDCALRVLDFNQVSVLQPELKLLTQAEINLLEGDNYNFIDSWKEPILNQDMAFIKALGKNIKDSLFLTENFHSYIHNAIADCESQSDFDYMHRFYYNFMNIRKDKIFYIHLEHYIYEFMHIKLKNSKRIQEHLEILDFQNVVFFYDNSFIEMNSVDGNSFLSFLANVVYLEAIDYDIADKVCDYLSLKEAFVFKQDLKTVSTIPKYSLKTFMKLKSKFN